MIKRILFIITLLGLSASLAGQISGVSDETLGVGLTGVSNETLGSGITGIANETLALPGGGSPAFIGSVGEVSVTNTVASTAVSLTAAIEAGNLSVVLISCNRDVTGVVDDGGNTYSEAVEYTAPGELDIRIWYSVTTTALSISDDITVSWATTSFSDRVIEIVEAENVTSLDTTGQAVGFTDIATATATPTADSFVIGMGTWSGSASVAAANNSTLLSLFEPDDAVQTFYKNETATVATSWGFDLSTDNSIGRAVAVFK